MEEADQDRLGDSEDLYRRLGTEADRLRAANDEALAPAPEPVPAAVGAVPTPGPVRKFFLGNVFTAFTAARILSCTAGATAALGVGIALPQSWTYSVASFMAAGLVWGLGRRAS